MFKLYYQKIHIFVIQIVAKSTTEPFYDDCLKSHDCDVRFLNYLNNLCTLFLKCICCIILADYNISIGNIEV